MDDPKRLAAALHEEALVWDSHACLPLHPDADLGAARAAQAGRADFVSINVGMDMNRLDQIVPVIASFRAGLRARPEPFVPVEVAARRRSAPRPQASSPSPSISRAPCR